MKFFLFDKSQIEMLDYDPDKCALSKILKENGYKIIARYTYLYSSDSSNTFMVSSKGQYCFAKFYKFLSSRGAYYNTWDELKSLHKELSESEIVPKIVEFIDIDAESGFIINECFGDTVNGSELEIYRHIVYETLDKLHNKGYIHGDIHSENILLSNDRKQARLIDIDQCFKLGDSRIDRIIASYGASSFEEAVIFERENYNMEI